MSDQDLAARARAVVDANRYLTLATADEAGVPWATPVWYAAVDGRGVPLRVAPRGPAFAQRRRAPAGGDRDLRLDGSVGGAQAVYVAADAHELTGAEVDRGIAAYSAEGEAQGLEPWTREHVQPPAPLRLYRAVARECFVLGSGDERIRVEL
jgi:hypothetical protein